MKLFFSILFLLNLPMVHANSKIAIQQECNGHKLPLYIADGDFIQENTFRLPYGLNKESFTQYILKRFPEKIEKAIVESILTEIFLKIESNQRETLRKVTKQDLLLDYTHTCIYDSIIEFTSNEEFLISTSFDLLTPTQQFYYILEAINYPSTPNYSDVGNRNYTYNLLDETYMNKSEKNQLELKKQAGNLIFYKDSAHVDINKVNFYNEETGSIKIASLIKNSPIITPSGVCKSSDIRPVRFEDDGILSVFTVSDPCHLKIGGKTYTTRQNSVVEVKNYGIFINHPMPRHITSIYVPVNFSIKNKDVNLVASADPTKKSKLHFADNASGEIIAYTQFLGEVNFQGEFYKMKDYFNLAKYNNSDFIAMMTLTEKIEVFQAGYKNYYTDSIRLATKEYISTAMITGKNPKLMIRGKLVNVRPNTRVIFLLKNPNKVLKLTLNEPTKLLTVDGSYQIFPANKQLSFTPSGLVE